jgi:flavorubredoxin
VKGRSIDLQEIAHGVDTQPARLPVGLTHGQQRNTYLIRSPEKTILIDPGHAAALSARMPPDLL